MKMKVIWHPINHFRSFSTIVATAAAEAGTGDGVVGESGRIWPTLLRIEMASVDQFNELTKKIATLIFILF
jgi:hypothetical protein